VCRVSISSSQSSVSCRSAQRFRSMGTRPPTLFHESNTWRAGPSGRGAMRRSSPRYPHRRWRHTGLALAREPGLAPALGDAPERAERGADREETATAVRPRRTPSERRGGSRRCPATCADANASHERRKSGVRPIFVSSIRKGASLPVARRVLPRGNRWRWAERSGPRSGPASSDGCRRVSLSF